MLAVRRSETVGSFPALQEQLVGVDSRLLGRSELVALVAKRRES